MIRSCTFNDNIICEITPVWVTASILQPNSKFLDSPIMPFPSFSFSSALSRFPSPLYCPLRIIPAQCPFCSSTPIQHSNGSDVASICRILSSFLAPCVPNLSVPQWISILWHKLCGDCVALHLISRKGPVESRRRSLWGQWEVERGAREFAVC